MCAGAIDGSHIPITTPLENHAAYVNSKSFHSLVMQALVDDRYLFRDIVVGWPGSVHDARVFSNSELYTLGCSGQLFPPDLKESILGREIQPVILGDPAYPLLTCLIKGYPENSNTPRIQRHFNYRLSRARMTVENTFGHWNYLACHPLQLEERLIIFTRKGGVWCCSILIIPIMLCHCKWAYTILSPSLHKNLQNVQFMPSFFFSSLRFQLLQF